MVFKSLYKYRNTRGDLSLLSCYPARNIKFYIIIMRYTTLTSTPPSPEVCYISHAWPLTDAAVAKLEYSGNFFKTLF